MSFFKKIQKNKNLLLLVHNNPDGDALGSSLALMFYFIKLKYNVNIVSPTKFSENLSWLPGTEKIIFCNKKNYFLVKKIIFKSDFIFFIDFNNYSRISTAIKELLYNSVSKKILIDHHPNPTKFDVMIHDSTVPATSILVYRIISDMNNLDKIDQKISTCLYIGIMMDTGCFRFPSVTSETHLIASKLMKNNLDLHNIYNKYNDKYNENKLKLLSIALNRLKVIKKYHIAYTSIKSSDIFYPYQQGDSDGIVGYGLGIKNVILSVFFFQEKDEYPIKISFRSKGDFDVNKFSKKYFGGGGHKNASGGILKKSLSETIQYFLTIIQNYYDIIKLSI
ncbi:DHH family phosphoesterase [Blattabacterium cuenoti]|uniref:DHH family phosphoesterase n=1 Tax=Blattabacterium cuenoti TaxID=1653831 RepID=UPI00163CFCDA|nr:bifunctional oligoribonuclease/PAP phosphatase NrnA [Blattabacterium cuenoti]